MIFIANEGFRSILDKIQRSLNLELKTPFNSKLCTINTARVETEKLPFDGGEYAFASSHGSYYMLQ